MLALVFARAKTGKTIDAALSFPKARFFAYEPAGLYSVHTIFGHRPCVVHTPTFQAVTAALEAGFPEKVAVIDDLTLMAVATEAVIKKTNSKAIGQNVYNFVRDVARDMIDTARATGKIVIFNGHEREARINYVGKFVRGGIDLPMALSEVFTSLVDFAARAVLLDADLHGFTLVHPHRAVYWLPNGSSDWAVGSRLGAAACVPMNLGEIFRASGLHAPERTIPWQEKIVVKVAAELAAAGDGEENIDRRRVLSAAYAKLLAQKVPESHARWTLRDAEDRYIIQRFKLSLGEAYATPETEEVETKEEEEA